jgi:ribosome-binding factor A
MAFRGRSRKDLLSACASIGPEDGVDPRLHCRAPSAKVVNRKALQLCGQVARTLASVLAGESGDDVLRDLLVESVVPAPNASRLLVTVSRTVDEPPLEIGMILRRLDQARGWLRSEIASVVNRRKIPDLTFHVRIR